MGYKYSVKDLDPERTAKAVIISAPFSTKQAIEVCNALRGKRLDKAMSYLEDVIVLKQAVPMKRFNRDMGHRKSIAAGRYPIKASTHILDLLKSANANAQEKGLSTADLFVDHIVANRASRPWRAGRHVRRKGKRTHVEVVVKQRAEIKKKAPAKKQEKSVTETKPAVKTPAKEEKAVEKKPAAAPAKKEAKPAEKKAPANKAPAKKAAAKTQSPTKKKETKQ